jgi:hypothetical protein
LRLFDAVLDRLALQKRWDGVMQDQTDWQQLLTLIKDRRRTVDDFLRSARPRAERLTYVSVTSSAFAAALTAGPALGGQRFTDGVAKSLELGGPEDVWRPLCLAAMVVSVIAAISANLSKAKNAEARIVSAEACNAELEGLQALVEFRQVSLEEALKMYQQYVSKIPFVAERRPPG